MLFNTFWYGLIWPIHIATAISNRPASDSVPPTAHIRNGTLEGFRLQNFQQDLFLGVPFARPPEGDLRLRRPVPLLSESWTGHKLATKRSASCPGYLGFSENLTMGEDCLTLDVVKPTGTTEKDKLPVFVWIYGGGLQSGGSADAKYNTSYLVNASVEIEKPMIAVSINYRVGGWGFLASEEVVEDGASNIGLFDQRLALAWIHENIAAFGGDPDKITIAGESAGGFSVGCHLVGFGGDHGGLFRAAIMQSGTAIGTTINTRATLPATYQPFYDNITQTVGCSNALDSLACLRTVPYDELYDAFAPFSMMPILDGEFLSQQPSESFRERKVANVAILAGSNTDEGTAEFFGPRGTLHTDADVRALLAGLGAGLDSSQVDDLMVLYPDDPTQGCPFNTGSQRFEHNGRQYKRGAAIVGDQMIHAGRRATVQYFSSLPRHERKSVYSYRFDQPPWNGILELVATVPPVYSTHYAEICFVFNIDPSASRNNTNWIGPYPEFYALSNLMSRSWISFVHELDPNRHGVAGAPRWPEYGCGGENLVFQANGSYVEKDDWRVPQLEYWTRTWG